jgi:hypothetical protein
MSFTCPRCGMTSHHPEDERQGYCGNCHDWTGSDGVRPVLESDLNRALIRAGQLHMAGMSHLGALGLAADEMIAERDGTSGEAVDPA